MLNWIKKYIKNFSLRQQQRMYPLRQLTRCEPWAVSFQILTHGKHGIYARMDLTANQLYNYTTYAV